MLVAWIAMLAILLICAGVGLFVAFPHRGERLPAAPWLGKAMARAADAVPTLDPEDDARDAATAGRLTSRGAAQR